MELRNLSHHRVRVPAKLQSAEAEARLSLVCRGIFSIRVRADFLGGKFQLQFHRRSASRKHGCVHRTDAEEPALHSFRFSIGFRDSREGAINELIRHWMPSMFRAFVSVV